MRERITTHVLDLSRGRPGAGIPVRLLCGERLVAQAATDDDGRVEAWDAPLALEAGPHRLVFSVADHFAAQQVDAFYDEIDIRFVVRDPDAHHHVPLLLGPFGYSTYRGS